MRKRSAIGRFWDTVAKGSVLYFIGMGIYLPFGSELAFEIDGYFVSALLMSLVCFAVAIFIWLAYTSSERKLTEMKEINLGLRKEYSNADKELFETLGKAGEMLGKYRPKIGWLNSGMVVCLLVIVSLGFACVFFNVGDKRYAAQHVLKELKEKQCVLKGYEVKRSGVLLLPLIIHPDEMKDPKDKVKYMDDNVTVSSLVNKETRNAEYQCAGGVVKTSPYRFRELMVKD